MSVDQLPEDPELLAAELALGLIDGDERRSAEARLERDASFAAAHARWQSYGAAMFADAGEDPPIAIWRAIAARLPANDISPVAHRQALRRWRLGTLAASAAALVLGVVALQKPTTLIVHEPVAQASVAPLVAILRGKAGLVTVSFDPGSGRVTSTASGLDIGDHSAELWVIPVNGKPRALGVIERSAPSWVKIPKVATSMMVPDVTIAVSVEPVGGSPTGQPTGPVILSGSLTAI